MGLAVGTQLSVKAKNVAAGVEPERTNHLLQALCYVATSNVDSAAMVARLDAGEKPGDAPSAVAAATPRNADIQSDGGAAATGQGSGWECPVLPAYDSATDTAAAVDACQAAMRPLIGADVDEAAYTKGLSRPPHKFIARVVQGIDDKTGFFDGVFAPELFTTSDKAQRLVFFSRLNAYVGMAAGFEMPCVPKKMAAGMEVPATNYLLASAATLAAAYKQQGVSNKDWLDAVNSGAAPGSVAAAAAPAAAATQAQAAPSEQAAAADVSYTGSPDPSLGIEALAAASVKALLPYWPEVEGYSKKLQRPPVKVLCGAAQHINAKTGLFQGVFTAEQFEPADKPARLAFLKRLCDFAGLLAGVRFGADAKKMASGMGVEDTNHLLQALCSMAKTKSAADVEKAAKALDAGQTP